MYQIGDVLSIPYDFYRHYMIVIGPNLVAHGSKDAGQVVYDTVDQATKGKAVHNHGRWSSLPSSEIVRQASECVGKSYKLFSFNCEHVVRKISGLKITSPQVIVGVGLGALAFFLFTRMGK
ncbi:lecithin retinol acyltransferase family protein [Terasakiella sp.]|uniref:lecithin retinol acyltransferase family protein n=1 Tax=Terasakiella sp. TaxID=2034861 RepID=UPI003AA8ECCB